MELLSQCIALAIAIVLGFFLSQIIKPHGNSHKRKLAPEAGGRWPIVGHLPLLASSRSPHKLLATIAGKYGPIFRISLGVNKALVISSWEMAKECLQKNDKAVSGRPKSVVTEIYYNHAMSGLGSYGPYWRNMRKLVVLELLSNHRLNMLSYVWKSEVKILVNKLYELWTTKKSLSTNNMVLVNLSQLILELNMNIIVRILSGKQYEMDSEEKLQLEKVIRDFSKQLGTFAIGDALPILRWLDLGGQEKEMKKTFRQIDSILQGWLEEHKQKRLSNGNDQTKADHDFMDVMISATDHYAQTSTYDADTIKAHCLSMIAGQGDTTTITLIWALTLLLNNPRVLKKAKEELDIQVGKERQVNERDIPRLVYLQAVVKETLRLYPPGPLMAPREVIEDCEIGGYHVEAKTRIIVNVSQISRDPRVWEEPLEFRPERFLNTHKNVDLRGHHFEFIPFGAGRRICPGLSFALQVVHLALASFLHAFEFSSPSDGPVDMTESFGLTSAKDEPLEVLIEPTFAPNIYIN